jgi:alkaline phosphatase
MPPDGGVLAVNQQVDIRIEATSDSTAPPAGLLVLVNGTDVTPRNMVRADERAPANSTNFLLRAFSVDRPGALVIEARTADGARASARLTVEAWGETAAVARARNVIVMLGDGMGAAHRTAARIMSRGMHNGRAGGRLAMDDLEVTGMVMTASLNSVITDSSPGMAAYSSGQKGNNNQQGVFPDNTADPFDNPRVREHARLP